MSCRCDAMWVRLFYPRDATFTEPESKVSESGASARSDRIASWPPGRYNRCAGKVSGFDLPSCVWWTQKTELNVHHLSAADLTALTGSKGVPKFIYPSSPFKKYWDVLIAILILYSAWVIPERISFYVSTIFPPCDFFKKEPLASLIKSHPRHDISLLRRQQTKSNS